MRTKCHSCVCNTCMTVCCDRKNCTGKKESCENYSGFRQMSIFEQGINRNMRVLAACEESQRVCIEFRKLGHEAYSCDIQPCSGGHPEWHIHADAVPLLNGNCEFQTSDGAAHRIDGRWDMILAFPPCTHLASSGAKHFEQKRKDGRQKQGIEFFMRFVKADCKKIAIENPVGIMSTKYRRPDQIIQPWMFGDAFEKTTCLWLKGLKELEPTEIVQPPPRHVTSGGKSMPEWYSKGGKDRQKNRSKTFPGIARAMAEQWGAAEDAANRENQKIQRHPIEYYGLTDERVAELVKLIQSDKYACLASQAAYRADKDTACYILLSIKKNLSYDALDKIWARGEIGRIPCSRTGFYYAKKYFYHLFDLEMRKIGM